MVTRSGTTWGREAKMKSFVEIISLGVCMIPFLLWKGYQDDNIWLVILKFGKTIASITCYVNNTKFWKNSSIVANCRDDLYMHQVMLKV